MSLLIVFLAAAAGPLFVPARNLLAGILGLAGLLTALTVWGLASANSPDDAGAPYAALAIAGVVAGAVVRLAVFRARAYVEDQALRRQLPRELPERHR
ncbi:MAG: hypothetical protein JWO33_2396 [Caulobacteraceae bacterium]|nr:hypothetical protein [Caulobacteraceae bacterium]